MLEQEDTIWDAACCGNQWGCEPHTLVEAASAVEQIGCQNCQLPSYRLVVKPMHNQPQYRLTQQPLTSKRSVLLLVVELA
jgi:hypothetical protein